MKTTWFKCEKCGKNLPCVIGVTVDPVLLNTPDRCPYSKEDKTGIRSKWQNATGPDNIDMIQVQRSVIIDGKTIELSEESYQALKRSLL